MERGVFFSPQKFFPRNPDISGGKLSKKNFRGGMGERPDTGFFVLGSVFPPPEHPPPFGAGGPFGGRGIYKCPKRLNRGGPRGPRAKTGWGGGPTGLVPPRLGPRMVGGSRSLLFAQLRGNPGGGVGLGPPGCTPVIRFGVRHSGGMLFPLGFPQTRGRGSALFRNSRLYLVPGGGVLNSCKPPSGAPLALLQL